MVTARPRIEPASISPRAAVETVTESCTWFAIRAFIDAAALRKGTCTMSIPAMLLSISQERCPGVAMPEEPQLSSPGFALASANSSAGVFTGRSGLTTST